MAVKLNGFSRSMKGAFDASTWSRGESYFTAQRVSNLAINGDEEGVEVSALVQGNSKRPYQTTVWLDFEGVRIVFVDSACSCPVGVDCKHVVAVLIEFGEILESKDETPPHAAGKSHPNPAGVAPEVDHWLGALLHDPVPSVQPAPVGDRQHVIVYLLQLGSPSRLSLGKSYPLKKGGMSKPVSYVPHDYDLGRSRRNFVSPSDETPLRLYHGLAVGHLSYNYLENSVALTGAAGGLLLVQAARTGRLYLESDLLTPVSLDTTRPLSFKWLINRHGKQQLTLDLPPHVSVIPTEPLHYLDPVTHTLGELRSDMPEHLLQKLLRAPPLSEHEASMARPYLEQLASKYAIKVPLPEALESELPKRPPLPILRLTTARFRHTAMSSLQEEYPVAELFFDYAEAARVSGCAQPDPLLKLETGNHARLLRRDQAVERAAWQQLQAVGLESCSKRLPNYMRLDAAHECLLTSPTDERGWVRLLDQDIKTLEDHGFSIEYADDFPIRLSSAEDWFVDVEESIRNDWFDLDLGVVVDGERISLIKPLINLLRDQPRLPEKLAGMSDEQTLPLRLDEVRLLPLPVARLRAWVGPLLEFIDDGRLRLARHHAAVVSSLETQPSQWQGGDALRTLGQRLRDFQGIDTVPPAPGFRAQLRPYQQAGLNWLQFLRDHGLAGVLADDMGLGKTVQTLAHLHLEKSRGRADRPSLVIAPTSLLPNWESEARQFAPDLKVLRLHGPDRGSHFESMRDSDLILTTYPLLVRDRDALLNCEYHLLVLDEAQFIKNPKAQSHQVARKLSARHRLSLTGTPLENHLGELWAQFDFLMPGLLGDAKRFMEIFRQPIERNNDDDARKRLAARVAPFMLRRTRDQVLKDLPPRTEIVRWVELAEGQRDLYESLRVAFDRKLRDALKSQGVGRSQIMILDALLKLRQACCDPRLVKLSSAAKVGERGIAASAKLQELMSLLEELIDEGRKILLFSQFTSMLTLIEAELKTRKFGYVKLTGQTRDRDTPVREFQAGNVPIFMISLKAGGTGLNLTAADTVIHYDPWWNPAVEEQATARAHRIGQTKPVFVYKMLGRGTVEEKILALQDRKRGLADQMLAGGQDSEGGHLITAEDLDVLFKPLEAD